MPGSLEESTLEFRAMACPCRVRAFHEEPWRAELACVQMRDEVQRIEAKYSRYLEDNLVARINRSAGDGRGVLVDEETAGLLDYAQTAWRESGGLFDPTSGVLRRAWDFRAGVLPAAGAVEALLPRVGWQRLRWRRPHLVLPLAGMELDFGGFGKEYAADSAAARAQALGIAHGIVDLGGDVRVIGSQPDGSPWRIGVRDPARPARALASLALQSGAIATSGDYERGFTIDGRRYGHLLDPRSGWPVDGFASVSVLAGQCLVAGTASTVALLKGIDEGRKWLDSLGLPWLAVHRDGRVEQQSAPGG